MSVGLKIPTKIAEDFIEQNFQYKISQKGEYRINDPFSSDSRYRLHINTEDSVYFSYDRQEGGQLSSFMTNFLSLDKESDLMQYLVSNFSINFEDTFSKIKISKSIEDVIKFPEETKWFNEENNLGAMGNSALKYLKDRSIDSDGLGYIFGKSEYNERIIIPFYENKEIVYFIARSFTDSKLRYKNPKMDRGEIVFNIDDIEDEVVIVEGVFDALSFNRKKQIATAMLTSKISRGQVAKILDKEPSRLIFVPDNDSTGEKTLQKNIELFFEMKSPTLKLNAYIYRLPNNVKDFNELKVKTGKDYILLSECQRYEKLNLAVGGFLSKLIMV